MPRYGYCCDACGSEFELVRPMRESGEPGVCPAGHGGARRTFRGVVGAEPKEERPSIEQIQAEHHLAAHGHGHGHGHTL